MAYTSLYRRFRPQTFDAMIGQEHIRKTLRNTISTRNIAHAYLFTGTRGTGKTSTAKIFARAINCLNPLEDGSPCGVCKCCVGLSNPENMDIIEIDAASNNSVDGIRNISDKANYTPTIGKYRVYIVDEVHMLSKAAFNAFLKTLEEPPEHVVFILATTDIQKIPATILSRCIRFDFRLLSKEDLTKHLTNIFNQIGVKAEQEAIMAIAESGNGSVRDALSVADMVISYCGDKEIEYKDVLEVLGASSPDKIVELCDYIVSGEISEALTLANSLVNLGKSVGVLADDIAKMLNNFMFVRNCQDAKNMLGLPVELYTKIKDAAMPTTNFRITRAIDIFADVQNSLRYSSISKVILETAIAKACDTAASLDTTSVIKRLLELEAFKRSMQGASLPEGTTLNGQLVWGNVLTQLNNDKRFIVEYTVAAKIKKDEVYIKDKILYVSVHNKAVYDELSKYSDFFTRFIKKDYMEIVKVEFNYVIDEKQENIEKVKNLFKGE